MISFKVTIQNDFARLADKADKASVRSLQRAAFGIRKEAVGSITTSADAASPGEPIHTRRGLARRAIRYEVNKSQKVAVIGSRRSVLGDAMGAHEHGGMYKGQRYPKRPVMGPALERSERRLAGEWKGTVN